jgi:hypothetical protein
MSDEKKSRIDELDDFWDLSELVPKRTPVRSSYTKTEAVEISAEKSSPQNEQSCTDRSDTVIKRYINPLHYENKKIRKESYEKIDTYYPENSLLHEVTIRKRKSNYDLYTEFYEDAIRYRDMIGKPCDAVPYYSYVPQYNQLTDEQLAYYLWWRSCFREGKEIEIDYSYVLLFVFELINLGEAQDVKKAQSELAQIWNIYHKKFSTLAGRLALWICDFSLLHRLPAPDNIQHSAGKYVPSLKEFYLHMPRGDYEACARSLIKYGTEYDYRQSKFATKENMPIFDKHIFGAVLTTVKFYSSDGVMLSRLSSEDSKLIRNTYDGALCVTKERYELEVKYCSFSRSNELRYLMADIVKYAENKIRAHLGIKSKLTVYSVSIELQKEIDCYFEQTLFSTPKPSTRKEEKHAYDVLYDLPKTTLSLEKAKQIENDSWGVTKDLISALEAEELAPDEPAVTVEEIPFEHIATQETIAEEKPLRSHLGEYLPFVEALLCSDLSECEKIALQMGKLIDSVVDAINEIAVEVIGDLLIEDGDGGFTIIEDYREMI